jgi:hypothetical protein
MKTQARVRWGARALENRVRWGARAPENRVGWGARALENRVRWGARAPEKKPYRITPCGKLAACPSPRASRAIDSDQHGKGVNPEAPQRAGSTARVRDSSVVRRAQ